MLSAPANQAWNALQPHGSSRPKSLRQRIGLVCVLLALGAGSATAQSTGLKKLIQQYALTSANDFPQRDPQDWRLLGSNDGGKTWTTLDIRKDELFRDRHERRAFKVNTPSAFGIYRLQIDRVRDPKVANSVQLAELELIGTSEDDLSPVPIFTDDVTTQGDNPPSESVGKLFDGRVETKWLDRPDNKNTCASWVQWRYAPPSQTLITNVNQLLALRARADDEYQIQLAVVLVGPTGEGDRLSVADATGCLELAAVPGAETLTAGQSVLLRGVSAWSGKRVGVKGGRAEGRGDSPTSPERIVLEQPLTPQENLKWVEIEGELRYRHPGNGEASFDVYEDGLSMRVYLRCATNAPALPPTGSRVAVRGICQGGFNDQGHWVAATLWAAGRSSLSLVEARPRNGQPSVAASVKGAANAPATLTKIEQIRRLPPEQLNNRPHVKVQGVITEMVGAFMQDDTAGIQVAFAPEESRKITEPGMFIEVEGWGGLGDVGNPVISADRITVLGKGKLPQPQRLSLSQLMSGRMDAQWIEMEGVVRTTDGAHLLMICYGREIMASVGAGAAAQVNELVDAAVRVRGVGITALDDQGRIQGIHLLIPSLENIEVMEPPGNPATLPIRPIGSLLGLSGPRESFHRVKVEGVVTFHENQKLFLQDASGAAMAVFKEDVVLDARFGRSRWLFWRAAQTNATARAGARFVPGDRVQVVGFPETRGYSPVLTEVSVVKFGGPDAVNPYEATVNGVGDGRADSRLVTVDGILRGQNVIGDHIVMTLEWYDRILQILVPAGAAAPSKIETGTRLRITGVCQVDSMPYTELGLRVAAVRILTRSAADLVVLARPPWWTVQRALTVMGGMAFVILAALIWIKQLRRQVGERTAQLTAEIQLREQTERQRALEQERSRIAKDLHDDLGANLAQIVFLSQRVEGGRHEGQDVERWFGQIPATAQRTIQSLDEIVWAINPHHDSLESLANYLSQFAQEHLMIAGVRCVLDVPMVLPALPLSAELRHNLLLTTREALQNTVSHSGATEVQLALRLDDLGLTIEIADNGRGFDPAAVSRSGNGLPNMRRRLETIGGRLELQAQPGQGARVRLFVPAEALHGRVIGGNGHPREEL